ncbi:MAG: phosphate ABC transporter ATP-binding protein [Sulfolobaceae archaeon]
MNNNENNVENVFEIYDLRLSINGKLILKNISSLKIPKNSVFGIMGPSGSGKSTLLKVLNRLIELYDGVRVEGKVLYMGKNIFEINPIQLRKEVGMVFQQPNPFPHMSIYDNIAYPLKAHGIKDKAEIRRIVEDSLRRVGLWDEVKDRLNSPASQLSGGQQQRLTIARALALRPKVLLMDEPTSMIDVVSAQKIENLIIELKKEITIIIVSHNPHQAARVADYVAFIYSGELVEWGPTKEIFTSPKSELTERYVIGRLG